MVRNSVAPRVLEIGYGDLPAVRQGEYFKKHPDATYIGIDLPRTIDASFVKYAGKRAAEFPEVAGSMHTLPFRSGSFDFVLMRSVYGQFDAQPNIITPVRYGMYDVQRVLKPLGMLAVVEDSTPNDESYVKREIIKTGLRIVEAATQPNALVDVPPDDRWLQLRSQFFTDTPTCDGPSRNFNTPYIIMAEKPSDLAVTPRAERMLHNFYADPSAEWITGDIMYEFPSVRPTYEDDEQW